MDDPEAYTPEEEEKLRQIEAELEAARKTEFKLPEDDRDAVFDQLEQRARTAKQTLKKHTPEGSAGNFVGPEGGRNLGKGLQIAYAIIGVPLVGFGIGWLIDNQTGGTQAKGIATILGSAIAIWYAIKSANKP